MPANPALDISGAHLRFGTVTALDGLDLVAFPGQVTAVLGPNGAGKTTMMRCATGLLRPDAGTFTVLGGTPEEAVAAGGVGMMPQSVGAWSGIKPMELLRYLAGLHTNPLPIDPLAARLGIDTFAGTGVRRLSGGQQQALNLAGALIGRPRLLFLDEPTAGMDPHARRSVWELLGQVRDAGVAIVLTTHAMDEAETLADRISIVDRGRTRLSGTPSELTAKESLEEVFLANTRAVMS